MVIAACLAVGTSAPPALAAKVVAVLSRTLPPYEEALKGFAQAGPFEVQTLNLEGSTENAPRLRREVTDLAPDEVLIFGAEAFDVLKDALPDVPVVYSMVLEPLARKGRVAGVLMQIPVEAQIERIHKLLPRVRKIGLLYDAVYSLRQVNQARRAMTDIEMTLVPIAVEGLGEVPTALKKLRESGIEALWSMLDKTTAQPAAVERMIAFSLEHRLPFIGLSVYHVKAGALAALSVDYTDLGLQTGVLARRLLANEVPSGHVETPRMMIVYLNEGTQRRLGLKDLVRTPEVKVVQ